MKEKKSIPWSMNTLLICFLLLAASMFLLSLQETLQVNQRLEEQMEIEVQRQNSQRESKALGDASDYLTSQVWHYLATGERQYMDAYWTEIEIDQKREKAMAELEKLHLSDEEITCLRNAKQASDALVDQEAWAMRLYAESVHLPYDDMPTQIQQVMLSEEELQLSDSDKKERALAYVFGSAYTTVKDEINQNISRFKEYIVLRNDAEVKQATQRTYDSLVLTQVFHTASMLLFILTLAIFYIYVLKPFQRYNKELKAMYHKEGSPLTASGTKEMREFANRFNTLYADWKAQNENLQKLNAIDPLTQLANRGTLDAYMHHIMDGHGDTMGLLMIDIDSFKAYNDTYGHLFGDHILEKIGETLNDLIPLEDGIAARLGGEEFVVALKNATMEDIDRCAENILERMRHLHFEHATLPFTNSYLTVSIGSSMWRKQDTIDVKSLIHQADLALYQAKKFGKNQHVKFAADDFGFIQLDTIHTHDAQIESEMLQALHDGQFVPYFQPKYDTIHEQIVSAEALVRWQHPSKGLLFPDYFIPLFERNGFVTQLDLYMFERVCAYLQSWIREGRKVVPIACNFSRLHFQNGHLAEKLKEIRERYHVPAHLLEIEVTESVLIDQVEQIGVELKKLQAMGFSIAIDDFGVGYSSLGVLQELPVNSIKIDRSFLQRNLSDHKNIMLISGILFIAKVLKLQVICEGVETQEQLHILQKIGCPIAQGYYFSKPIAVGDFMKLMEDHATIQYEKEPRIEDGFIHFMNFLFVDKNFEKARAYISEDFVWQDIIHKQKITSIAAFETYYEEELKNRNISFQLKKFTVNTKYGIDYLQGEADMIYFDKGVVKNQATTIYAQGNPAAAIFLEVRFLYRDSLQY